jgi:cytochrome b pre-mRNA-processing protein 3
MKLVSKITRGLFDSAPKQRAREQYIALVQRSRNPFFYRDCAVPDTLDGRFEIIVLHLFLALPQEQDDTARRLLLEAFFADMDRSLREMGVGDVGVGKRVHAMAEAAFGRLKAYGEAKGDAQAMREALRRNVYAGQAEDAALTALMRECGLAETSVPGT